MGIRHATNQLKESPPYEYNHYHPHPDKRPVLFEHQLPINLDRRPPILLAILPQPPRHLSHLLETVSSIQQILNILRHNLSHIPQFIIQLIQVLTCSAILVRLLGALHKGVKFEERVGATVGGEVLGGGVGGCEFSG